MGLFSFFNFWKKADSAPNKKRASGVGYRVGGYRQQGWGPSIQGPNNLAQANWEQLIKASRDAVRKFPLADSAIQRWEANIIGTGIQPHFNHPDDEIRESIQDAWDAWVDNADFGDVMSFYGIQSLLARELFEAGECFCRFHVVDKDDYLNLQLIESEQVPIWIGYQKGPWDNSLIRQGIIFDTNTDKRIGYHMYRAQPYDSVVNPLDATRFIDLPIEDVIHVMKPYRAGNLRGLPKMAAVLQALWDLDGYSDSERMRKRIAAMFAFFLEKPTENDDVMPTANGFNGDAGVDESPDAGIDFTKLEPGTVQELNPGETLVSPQVPDAPGYGDFMYEEIHKIAASLGLTYEMITGNLKGVNYSSARVGLLEVRRGFEQFQQQVVIKQFCKPVMQRWMREAVLSGHLELPADYADNPEVYEQCTWIADGWPWIDPVKEVQAAQMAVRSGFTSKSMVIRQNGFDPDTIADQIAKEREQETNIGIVCDTNSNLVLIGRETQPTTVTPPHPTEETDQEADEDENTDE